MGRGKECKIFKTKEPYENVDIEPEISRGGAALFNESAEDIVMHEEQSDKDLNLEFIFSDPFAAMLCYKALKPGLRIDMNKYDSHALSKKEPNRLIL